MSLRSDIHAALEPVTPPAPHLPTTAVDAAIRGDAPARRGRRGLVLFAVAAPVLLVIVGIATLRTVTAPSPGPAAPAPVPPATLVLTTWVADPTITAGPYPGYRPEIRMGQRMVASVHAEPDPNGRGWVLVVTFTAEGRRLFGTITTDAYGACPAGTCPGSHVTLWLGLTPEDVARWNERADTLYQRGGKLLADPYVQSPITGGTTIVTIDLTRPEAQSIAARLNHPSASP